MVSNYSFVFNRSLRQYSNYLFDMSQSKFDTNKILVLVSGHKYAGKDTAAKLLVKEYGFTRFAFADKLKDECSRCYNVPRKFFDDDDLKEAPLLGMKVVGFDEYATTVQHKFLYTHFSTMMRQSPPKDKLHLITRDDEGVLRYKKVELYWTPRALAVHKGSSERTVNPNYWVNHLDKSLEQNEKVVVSDWRYTNEWKRSKELAEARGFTVKTIRIDDGKKATSNDPSETQLDTFEHFDEIFDNKTKDNVENLYCQMRKCFY